MTTAQTLPLLPPLQGARVRLRPMTAANIDDALASWLNDPEVVRYSNQRFIRHTRESCERYFASFEGSPNLYVSLRWAEGANEHVTERAIGTLTAYRAPHHGTADVGILLGDRAAWGRGLGLEAWQLLTDWLLSTPGTRKITAGTLERNLAMIAVAERSGMHCEGRRRAQELVDGEPVDILHFARFAASSEIQRS